MNAPTLRHQFLIALITIASLEAMPAHAQTNASAAQLLFDEAKALTKKGDFAAACPKFVESHRLDPAGGTILHAADCHQSAGQLATAWTEYNVALSFAVRDKRADREKVAREQIAVLAPQLGKLVLTFTPEARAQQGLRIGVDRVPLDAAGWDAPIPLDRGPHTIELRAEGRRPTTVEVNVQDGATAKVAVVELGPEAPAMTSSPQPSSTTSEAPQDPGRGRRTLSLAIAGAGVVGLAVGGVFGVKAMSIGDQSGSCKLGPNGNGCPQSAVDDQESARSAATISTIAFIAGGALAAAGAVLYLTAPKATTSASARLPRLVATPTSSGALFTLQGAM